MNDKIFSEILSAYVDEEVTATERAVVETHLLSSADAQQELEDYRQLSRDLRELPLFEPSENFSSRVMTDIEKQLLLGPASPLTSTLDVPATPASNLTTTSRFARSTWQGVVTVACTLAVLLVLVPLLGPPVSVEPDGKTPSISSNLTATNTPERKNNLAKENSDRRESVIPAGNFKKGRQESLLNAPYDENLPYKEALVPAISLRNVAKPDTSELIFYDDLQKLNESDVGRVVTAFEKSGQGLAVVKLTVVDCRAGLEALQILLTRNAIQRQSGNGKASVPNSTGPTANGSRFVAVLVRASRDQLASAVSEMKYERQFRSLQIDRPISLAQFEPVTFGPKSHTFEKRKAGPTVLAGRSSDKPRSFGKSPGALKSLAGAKAKPSKIKANRTVFTKNQKASEPTNSGSSQPRSTLAELEKISQQLQLSLPASVLQSQALASSADKAESPRKTLTARPAYRPLVRGFPANGTQSRNDPRSLQVLFVIVNCGSKNGTNSR